MEKLIRKPTCMQPLKIYTFDYPEMLQYEKLQMDNYWLPDEPRAENDTHELKTGLTDTEYHGVLTTLKLFTLYEIQVGNEYWGGRFKRMFPRPEFDRVASINAMTELNIHAPFYNKVNEILRLNTDAFYESYAQDPILKERMDFIDELCSSKNDLLSLALFSLIEGAVLYSNFAFLKHFQVNGKNKLSSIVSGINFSVRDENIHSLAGAHAFRIAVTECKEEQILTTLQVKELQRAIVKGAKELKDHEYRIIEMIFAKGKIDGITERDMKTFIKSRINLCLNNLGIDSIYDINDNPIGKWFYDNITMPTIHDFFYALGSQYHRDWAESDFKVESNTYTFTG